jgi:DNA-binding CsgD family transcriptional regulator
MVERVDGHPAVDGFLAGVLDGSVIPTLLVQADTGIIVFANQAILKLLSMERDEVQGSFIGDISDPGDVPAMTDALRECSVADGPRRFLRHRYVGPGEVRMQSEVVVAGCGRNEGAVRMAVVQMRNLSMDSSLHVFLRFLADNPDGDSVAGALRHGLFAGLPVDSASIYSINRERTLALLRGASGLSASARRDYAVSPINLAAPGGVVTLTMELLWVSLTELTRRFPLLASDFAGTAWFETGEAICLPVVSRGKVIGTMFLVLRETVERRWHLHEMFHSAAQSLAPWMLLQEISEGAKPAPARTGKLLVSERELAVLRLVDSGTANADIAEQLGYSEATVRADLQRLSRLLGATGRREVVRRARELGLYEG